MRDRHGGRIALALISFALALGVSELVLRIRTPPSSDGLRGLHELRPDRAWLFGLRPGARSTLEISGAVPYEVNADGFRDRRYDRSKPPGGFRILVLGDSLSFGYGVAQAQTYPKVMEAGLGAGFEVLNFGVGGYNPYNEAALFADVGVSYQPDLVLAQFCINDLNDPTLHFDAQTLMHLGAIPDAAFPDPSERRSRASPWLVSALRLCRGLRLCAAVDDALIGRRVATFERAAEIAALRPHDALPPGPRREWIRSRYAEIAARAGEVGARFAVLAFPFRAQVEGDASDRVLRELAALGEAGGWATIDLLPAFRDARAEGSEALFIDIWHPTAAGHRVAASAIVADLRRRGTLPGTGSG